MQGMIGDFYHWRSIFRFSLRRYTGRTSKIEAKQGAKGRIKRRRKSDLFETGGTAGLFCAEVYFSSTCFTAFDVLEATFKPSRATRRLKIQGGGSRFLEPLSKGSTH
jgi:hypothetical protein